MLFSSLLFLFAYLPLVLLMYYVLPKRYRNGCLFVVSLFFYGWQEPVYIIVMLVSILVNFQIGKLVYRNLDTKQKAKTYVIASVIFNIALLAFFKYFNFFLWNISTLLQTGTLDIMQIALPIGISFYTFQTLTYPIDIYRKETLPQTNFMNFGMYVTFFPQLIAGPIVRYRDVSLQITNRTTSSSLFYEG
ncbi:MAG: MBOAT family protein, partial [Longicatena sp.]